MLDQEAMAGAHDMARALRRAAEGAGYPTQEIPAEQSPLPAFLAELPSGYQEEGWAAACTVAPLAAGGERFTCVQIYASITPRIPQGRLAEARRLVEGENERMLFGNVLLFSSRMSLKYVLSCPWGADMSAEAFLHAVRIFALQADACAERCDALVEGCADVETLLGESSFGE